MEQLFENLMALVDPNDFSKFFYKDFTTNMGTQVRIFSYNYASYTDWLQDDALECRGIMFEMDGDKPVCIMARPMQKFFNLDETPFTQNLDLNKIAYGMVKADGSLISTYVDKGYLRTKSKTSIFSTQAIEAQMLLSNIDHVDLHNRCLELANEGFTCNFEYVSPGNRIVIAYPERALILLNVRNNETGEYVPYSELIRDPVLRRYVVESFPLSDTVDRSAMVEEIRASEDIEGYVFVMEDGLTFKLKTAWYSNLHRVKDTINNDKDLFAVIVDGGSDDLKSLFEDDYSRNKIETYEKIFFDYLRESLQELNSFNKIHAGSDRKTYAITSQAYFQSLAKPELFGISMQQFGGNMSQDDLVKEINKVFLKNCDRFKVPEFSGN
ncbi:RNA ligase and tail fiber protein attachment catalyst [Acinetobacter phage vB_AbaM_Kimel]|uniref:RNA ligase 1 n=3 Tax=Lazarusvirus kimel TaxID=2843635 RepID=A0A6B9LQF5_9CAUD|nr:RNA ligase and tail fiber protein attachment catalyst [Acinetobacter phage vB_AbaM_Kimel]QKE55920.1 RNA ligase A [Acinetobacter phage Octan]QNO11340.1 RNA ligase A [Acinetobacter phage Meroveus]UQS93801.1 RNA ligase A [Acinetobacter phage AC4]CAH1068093.1 RNA ligase, T4 RnlA family [Acinetobacter phage MD-2021a]QHB48378.1 RNA ligase A [Acinetobacter phage vB_AbaM_Kimel]